MRDRDELVEAIDAELRMSADASTGVGVGDLLSGDGPYDPDDPDEYLGPVVIGRAWSDSFPPSNEGYACAQVIGVWPDGSYATRLEPGSDRATVRVSYRWAQWIRRLFRDRRRDAFPIAVIQAMNETASRIREIGVSAEQANEAARRFVVGHVRVEELSWPTPVLRLSADVESDDASQQEEGGGETP